MHLLVHVVVGRFHGAIGVFFLHGAQVEEHDDQAMVAQVLGACGEVPLDQIRDRGFARRGSALLGEHGGIVHILEVEAGDALRLLVLDHGEVRRLQPADEFAGFFVAHHHVGEHGVHAHVDVIAAAPVLLCGALLLWSGRTLRGRLGCLCRRGERPHRRAPCQQPR